MFSAKGGELFRTLLATAIDGIIVIDAEARIQLFNAACEGLFGFASEEVVGRNVKMLMPSPYCDEHDTYIRNYQKTGIRRIIGFGREVLGQRKDGSTFPMYLSVGKGSFDGQQMFVGIIHDLTERRNTERRLQDLQMELLHVSRLSVAGQMASALAHELNQPLTAIVNYSKTARRVLAGVDHPKIPRALELLDKAAAQTMRAGDIIQNLRQFIRKRDAKRSPHNLNMVVEEAMSLSLVGALQSNVQVRATLDPTLPPVMMDKVQVQQALINLISNALDAVQGCDRAALALFTEAGESGTVDFAISDTGKGIADDVLDRLFRPFVTTKEKGMGIGLTISQSIVEAHGGRIWVTPNEDRGVTFHVSLPVAGEGAADA